MANDDVQNDLVVEVMNLVGKFQPGGDSGPVEGHAEWEKLLASKSPEERELLEQLARFADIWRYFRERKEKLGGEVLNALKQVKTMSVPERIELFREINLKLMDRVGDAGQGARLRH